MTRPIFARGMGTGARGPEGPAGPASTEPGPQGDEGPRGPQGLPGVNAVANDEATAAQINDSDSETARALSASTARITARIATPVVDFVGDSLTYGIGTTGGQSYPTQAADGLSAAAITHNHGRSGARVRELTAWRSEVDADLVDGALNVLPFLGGTNNLDDLFGEAPTTAAATYAEIKRYHDDSHAAGWDKTIAITIPPRLNAAYNDRRLVVNQSIRDNWRTFADEFYDLANDPIMGDPASTADTTLYADGLHFANRGAGIVAAGVRSALARLGVTAPHSHPALLRKDQARNLFMPPTNFASTSGASPFYGWLMPSSGSFDLLGTIGLPSFWATLRADLWVMNINGASGTTKFAMEVYYEFMTNGEDYGTRDRIDTVSTFDCPVFNKKTRYALRPPPAAGITIPAGATAVQFFVRRSGDEVVDNAPPITFLGLSVYESTPAT